MTAVTTSENTTVAPTAIAWSPSVSYMKAAAPPVPPRALPQEELLGLFNAETVGRDVVLEPATLEEMWGGQVREKRSLEVVYEGSE